MCIFPAYMYILRVSVAYTCITCRYNCVCACVRMWVCVCVLSTRAYDVW